MTIDDLPSHKLVMANIPEVLRVIRKKEPLCIINKCKFQRSDGLCTLYKSVDSASKQIKCHILAKLIIKQYVLNWE